MASPAFADEFLVLHDKFVSSPIITGEWCASVDLAAVVVHRGRAGNDASTTAVNVHRLMFERVHTFEIESDSTESVQCPVSAVCWRTDGAAIAVGFRNGAIRIYSLAKPDECECEYRVHSAAVTELKWAVQAAPTESDDVWSADDIERRSLPFHQDDANIHHILPIIMTVDAVNNAGNSKDDEDDNSGGDNEKVNILIDGDVKVLNVLVSGDAAGRLHARLYGTLPIITIETGHAIVNIAMSSSLHSLSLVAVRLDLSVEFAALSTALLYTRRHELALLASHHQQIAHILVHIEEAICAMETRWQSVRKSIQLKIDPLQEAIDAAGGDGSVESELIELFYTGVPSQSVYEYMTRSLSLQPIMRIAKATDTTLDKLITIQLKCIQPALPQIIFRLDQLRKLARWEKRYECIGLDVHTFDKLIRHAAALMLKVEQLQRALLRARMSYRHFFDWLISSVQDIVGEAEDADKVENRGPFDPEVIVECIEHEIRADRVSAQMNHKTFNEKTIIRSAVRVADSCIETDINAPSADEMSFRAALTQFTETFQTFRDAPISKVSRSVTSHNALRSSTEHSFHSAHTSETKDPCISPAHFVRLFNFHSSESLISAEFKSLHAVDDVFDQIKQRVSLHYDDRLNSFVVAFAHTNPLLPSSIVTVITFDSIALSIPTLPPSTHSPYVFSFWCPGQSPTAVAHVMAVRYCHPHSLLILTRHDVNRRSSATERELAKSGGWSRLWKAQINADDAEDNDSQNQRTISTLLVPIDVAAIPSDITCISDFVRWRFDVGRHNIAELTDSGIELSHRSLSGMCARGLMVGSDRNIVSVTLTARDVTRVRHQRRRIVTIDMAAAPEDDDEDEDETEATDQQADNGADMEVDT